MAERTFIAVIDDDPSVRKALHRLLRVARMDVATFASGESFLVAALHRQPDCLVLDIRMPGMTGPELASRLLAARRSMPIVFITAHAPEEIGQDSGAAEVLRKPFDDQALLDAIERAIRRGGWR